MGLKLPPCCAFQYDSQQMSSVSPYSSVIQLCHSNSRAISKPSSLCVQLWILERFDRQWPGSWTVKKLQKQVLILRNEVPRRPLFWEKKAPDLKYHFNIWSLSRLSAVCRLHFSDSQQVNMRKSSQYWEMLLLFQQGCCSVFKWILSVLALLSLPTKLCVLCKEVLIDGNCLLRTD